MAEHLVVISVDALVYEDLELLGSLENTKKLLAEGSIVKRMKTVYPSLTHMVHTALMTGAAPGVNGVTANDHFTPGNTRCPWINDLKDVKCDTLFHAAKRAGLTTCACRWPVTAGGTDVIDFLVPEIMDEDRERQPNLLALHREMSSEVLYEDILKPNIGLIDWSSQKHPTDEIFEIKCACDIIRKYRPNLLMTHPSFVDNTRHRFGLFNDRVDYALRMTDQWIGQIMQAVKDAGIEETTDICVVSDHGHLSVMREVAFNVFLRERGWLEADEKGELLSWKAYIKSCDLSAEVYVADPADVAAVGRDLREMCDAGIYGVSEVLTAAEAEERYGLKGDFAYVIETDGCSTFIEDWNGPAVRVMDTAGVKYGHSDHGHMPEKGPQPPMIVCGPDFRKGVTIESGSILDEAPTFAAVLGLTLKDAQGMPLCELMR